MPEVRWLPEAEGDLKRLIAFLFEKNPSAAQRAAKSILDGCSLLASSPEIGRPMPDRDQWRELIIPFASGAYVLRYRQDERGSLVVTRVWHSREWRD